MMWVIYNNQKISTLTLYDLRYYNKINLVDFNFIIKN